jgi:hypothetical protein
MSELTGELGRFSKLKTCETGRKKRRVLFKCSSDLPPLYPHKAEYDLCERRQRGDVEEQHTEAQMRTGCVKGISKNTRSMLGRHFLAWYVERQIELIHHTAGQADAKCADRKFSRTAAGRLFARELGRKAGDARRKIAV